MGYQTHGQTVAISALATGAPFVARLDMAGLFALSKMGSGASVVKEPEPNGLKDEDLTEDEKAHLEAVLRQTRCATRNADMKHDETRRGV